MRTKRNTRTSILRPKSYEKWEFSYELHEISRNLVMWTTLPYFYQLKSQEVTYEKDHKVDQDEEDSDNKDIEEDDFFFSNFE